MCYVTKYLSQPENEVHVVKFHFLPSRFPTHTFISLLYYVKVSLFMVGKIHWRRDRLPTPVVFSFPCGSTDKESACNVGNLGSNHGLERSPGEGEGYSLQYSDLENSLYSPWGCKESEMTEQLSFSLFLIKKYV